MSESMHHAKDRANGRYAGTTGNSDPSPKKVAIKKEPGAGASASPKSAAEKGVT